MIDLAPEQLAIVYRLLAAHVPDCEVRAFGSRVSWTAKAHSDLDLALVGPTKISTSKLSRLREAFEESSLSIRVDLLDWHAISESFQKVIATQFEVIQQAAKVKTDRSAWKILPLEDCMSAIIDYRGKTPEKTTFGIPLVTAKVIKAGRIETPEEFIAEADFDEWMRRGMPKPGDIVMTTEAPLGEVAQLDGRKVALAQRVITLRGKPDVLDNTFLKYLLQSNSVQEELRSRGTGTTVVGIRQSELRKISLTLPPLAEQKAIAAMLGALDDKIELNRRMNATLEAMARTLFQGWFIDFDPVRAKLDGRQPVGLDPTTAALFPSKFQDSALGHIPKGWRAALLGEVIEVFDSKRVPLSGREREQRKGPYPYHGAASVMDYVDDYLFDGIYMLMGEDGSVINENGTPIIQYVWGKFWVNNHAHVLQGKNGICTEHLLLHLKESNIVAFVNGAVQPKLNQGNMNHIPFIIPPLEIRDAFSEVIAPIFAKIRSNADQSRTLAIQRDTLLPKLLSGELNVKSFKGEAPA